MAAHRFRSLFQRSAIPAIPSAACAFVPCPPGLMTYFLPEQQAYVLEVYRLARERTEAQLHAERDWLPVFSLEN